MALEHDALKGFQDIVLPIEAPAGPVLHSGWIAFALALMLTFLLREIRNYRARSVALQEVPIDLRGEFERLVGAGLPEPELLAGLRDLLRKCMETRVGISLASLSVDEISPLIAAHGVSRNPVRGVPEQLPEYCELLRLLERKLYSGGRAVPEVQIDAIVSQARLLVDGLLSIPLVAGDS